MNDATLKELHDLVTASIHGEMNSDQRSRLEQLVCDDAEARRLYVDYMKPLTTRLFALTAAAAIALTATSRQASATTTNFQEGVAPTGAYTHDATFIRSTEPDANQNGDPDLELIVGTTATGDVIRTLLEFDVSAIPAADQKTLRKQSFLAVLTMWPDNFRKQSAQRRTALTFGVTICFVAIGCGSGERDIYHDVSDGNDGTQGYAEIKDGTFDTSNSGKGITGGAYVARLRGFVPAQGDTPARMLFREYKQSIQLPTADSRQEIAVPASARAKSEALPDPT